MSHLTASFWVFWPRLINNWGIPTLSNMKMTFSAHPKYSWLGYRNTTLSMIITKVYFQNYLCTLLTLSYAFFWILSALFLLPLPLKSWFIVLHIICADILLFNFSIFNFNILLDDFKNGGNLLVVLSIVYCCRLTNILHKYILMITFLLL